MTEIKGITGSSSASWPFRGWKKRNYRLMAVILALGLASAHPAAAHHGWSTFDTRYAYFLSGTVTYVRWGNPHSEVRMTVDSTTLPAGWAERPLPPGGDAENGRLTMASARPYEAEHKEVHLVMAGPGWMERWGLSRPLEVGERIEAVGYLSSTDTDELRPVMFWLSNGQGVWQQLTAFPQTPEPAPPVAD
jgi:hypothetical protein